MNSHSSSSCLLTVIAIFVTVTAVCGAPFVPPPAKFAGHYANSSIIQEVVGSGSKITDREALIKTLPTVITHDVDTLIQCCDSPSTVTDQPSNSYCRLCNTMCHIGFMDARHSNHQLRTMCRCHAVSPCLHISFVINKALYGVPNNVGNHDNVSVEYRTFITSVQYQITLLGLPIMSWYCMWLTVFVYFYKEGHMHIRYVQNFTVSIASFTYITLIVEYIRQPTAIKLSGEEIPFKPNILSAMISELFTILFYLYLSQHNKTINSSMHPELSNYYMNKNQILNISKLMLAVDVLNIIDIIMEWDFTGIHILHFLKPSQGILVSYVLIFRPFASVIYKKLLERLRRQEGNANEVTVYPVYTITIV